MHTATVQQLATTFAFFGEDKSTGPSRFFQNMLSFLVGFTDARQPAPAAGKRR
jgi:hypothetical protein